MTFQRDGLIESISKLVEYSSTRDEFLIHLAFFGIDVSDENLQNHGKAKYTRIALQKLDDARIREIGFKSLKRFSGLERSAEFHERIQVLLEIDKPGGAKLYFAGDGKPDIVIRDLARGEVEVIDLKGCIELLIEQDDCVSWQFLWNSVRSNFVNFDALIVKLRESIPASSPQAREFFETYFQQTASQGNFDAPALLPELWLHYDPLTKKIRGGVKVLESQRCDFFLKIGRREIIVEVDGIQHYATADKKPDYIGYGRQCAWDRDRLLNGYEIYRFGTSEFITGFSESIKVFMKKLVFMSNIEIAG